MTVICVTEAACILIYSICVIMLPQGRQWNGMGEAEMMGMTEVLSPVFRKALLSHHDYFPRLQR